MCRPAQTVKPEPLSSNLFYLRAREHPRGGTAPTLATIQRRRLSPGGDAADVTLHQLSDTTPKPHPARENPLRLTAEDRDQREEVVCDFCHVCASYLSAGMWPDTVGEACERLKWAVRDAAVTKLVFDRMDVA